MHLLQIQTATPTKPPMAVRHRAQPAVLRTPGMPAAFPVTEFRDIVATLDLVLRADPSENDVMDASFMLDVAHVHPPHADPHMCPPQPVEELATPAIATRGQEECRLDFDSIGIANYDLFLPGTVDGPVGHAATATANAPSAGRLPSFPASRGFDDESPPSSPVGTARLGNDDNAIGHFPGNTICAGADSPPMTPPKKKARQAAKKPTKKHFKNGPGIKIEPEVEDDWNAGPMPPTFLDQKKIASTAHYEVEVMALKAILRPKCSRSSKWNFVFITHKTCRLGARSLLEAVVANTGRAVRGTTLAALIRAMRQPGVTIASGSRQVYVCPLPDCRKRSWRENCAAKCRPYMQKHNIQRNKVDAVIGVAYR